MKLSLLLKTRTLNVLIGCLMVAALLGACGGGESGNTTNTANTANTANTKTGNTNAAAPASTAPANTATSSTNAAPSADKIGVPECDEYIAKYEACINSKVPEGVRAQYRSAFDASRKAWRDAAATPQGKAGLAQGCKAANEQARTALRPYGCCW